MIIDKIKKTDNGFKITVYNENSDIMEDYHVPQEVVLVPITKLEHKSTVKSRGRNDASSYLLIPRMLRSKIKGPCSIDVFTRNGESFLVARFEQ